MQKNSFRLVLFVFSAVALLAITACAPELPVVAAQPINTPTSVSTSSAVPTISNEFPTIPNGSDISTSVPQATGTLAPTLTPSTVATATAVPTRVPTNTATPLPTRTPTRVATRTPRPATTVPTATAVPAYPMDAAAQRVFDLTNAARAQQGLPALKLNANLISAAGWFAQDMAAHQVGSLSHTDSLGRDAPTRITQFGYHYLYFAENIAMGYPTPEAVMAGWMGSEGHRENILNPKMTEIGIGHVQANGWDYWVEDFGTR